MLRIARGGVGRAGIWRKISLVAFPRARGKAGMGALAPPAKAPPPNLPLRCCASQGEELAGRHLAEKLARSFPRARGKAGMGALPRHCMQKHPLPTSPCDAAHRKGRSGPGGTWRKSSHVSFPRVAHNLGRSSLVLLPPRAGEGWDGGAFAALQSTPSQPPPAMLRIAGGGAGRAAHRRGGAGWALLVARRCAGGFRPAHPKTAPPGVPPGTHGASGAAHTGSARAHAPSGRTGLVDLRAKRKPMSAGAVVAGAGVAEGRAHVPGVADPGAAAQRARGRGRLRRPQGVLQHFARRQRLVLAPVIHAPFPDIAVHLVQTPGIRRQAFHRHRALRDTRPSWRRCRDSCRRSSPAPA